MKFLCLLLLAACADPPTSTRIVELVDTGGFRISWSQCTAVIPTAHWVICARNGVEQFRVRR